jgi:hypothetical protein
VDLRLLYRCSLHTQVGLPPHCGIASRCASVRSWVLFMYTDPLSFCDRGYLPLGAEEFRVPGLVDPLLDEAVSHISKTSIGPSQQALGCIRLEVAPFLPRHITRCPHHGVEKTFLMRFGLSLNYAAQKDVQQYIPWLICRYPRARFGSCFRPGA